MAREGHLQGFEVFRLTSLNKMFNTHVCDVTGSTLTIHLSIGCAFWSHEHCLTNILPSMLENGCGSSLTIGGIWTKKNTSHNRFNIPMHLANYLSCPPNALFFTYCSSVSWFTFLFTDCRRRCLLYGLSAAWKEKRIEWTLIIMLDVSTSPDIWCTQKIICRASVQSLLLFYKPNILLFIVFSWCFLPYNMVQCQSSVSKVVI